MNERTKADDVRTHYAVERYDVEFVFTERGAIASVESRVDIRALVGPLRYYYTGHTVDASGRTGRLGLTCHEGATIERINESPVGATDVYFRLDRDLNPEDPAPHTLRYLVEIGDDELADPQIMYGTRPGIREHTLTVQFASPALPEHIWSFGTSDVLQADRPEAGKPLKWEPSGRYSRRFGRIVPGWYYGFTWVWPQALRSAASVG